MMERKRKQPAISDLPEDIMIDILMRLPFESIKALNCVSKRWKSVITCRDFFHCYIKSNKVTTFSCNDGLYCFSIMNVTKDRRRYPPLTVHRVPMENNSWVWAWNGMACSYQYNREILFRNLLTGTSYNVTGPPLDYGLTRSWQCFGFSYDAHESDYKMMVVCKYDEIRNFYINKTVQNKDNSLFWVYGFKSLVWKRLEGFPYAKYEWGTWSDMKMPCPLNGVIHWIVTTKKHPMKMVIVTYDMHTCKFGEMSVPAANNEYNVMELGGELCLWRVGGVGVVDVWVMKEYGVEDSWTRLARFERARLHYKWFEPVTQLECEDGNRFVLFVSRKDGSLYWYDIQNNKARVMRKSSWMENRVVKGSKHK